MIHLFTAFLIASFIIVPVNINAASILDRLTNIVGKVIEPTKIDEPNKEESQKPVSDLDSQNNIVGKDIESKSEDAKKPVSEFDVYGMKLGMTEKELLDLFPNVKMTWQDPFTSGTYMGRNVRFVLTEETTLTKVYVNFANTDYGQGAIKIDYSIEFKGDIPTNYENIKKRVIDKYGPNENEFNKTSVTKGSINVCYGRCSDDIKTYDWKNKTIYFDCGQGLNVLLSKGRHLTFKLVDTCPGLKYYQKGKTSLKSSDIKF